MHRKKIQSKRKCREEEKEKERENKKMKPGTEKNDVSGGDDGGFN